ncbi:MAG: holo-ACP synthase [Acidaminococcaceae bacterium]
MIKVIIGIGCDLVEVARIKKAIENPRFIQKVYTQAEIDYCLSRGKQQTMSFAARFAAKEAVAKALGSGFRSASMRDVEITNDELGKPTIKLTGNFEIRARELGCKYFHVSLSHTKGYGLAQVILEGDKI